MSEQDIPYRKIVSECAGPFLNRRGVYLAEDHLLCLYSTAFSENYRRFYFRDIQAIQVCRTLGGFVGSMLLLILAVVLCLSLWANELNPMDGVVEALAWGVVPLLLAYMIVSLRKGGSCVCRVQTAVSSQVMPVTNVRGARRLVEVVGPLVEAAQGPLTPEMKMQLSLGK